MKASSGTLASILFLSALVAAGCGGGKSGPAGSDSKPAVAPAGAPAISAQARAEADQIFATRCFTCHGSLGKGDGPGSAGLTPKPRDLTSPEWQASVTDEHIEKIIAFGGIAVGKSAAMPPNPDLMGKKAVLAELRAKVRSLEKK